MHRNTVGFIDQGVVSLTTILLLVVAGRGLDLVEFGYYALGLATIQPCIAIVRTLVGETLLFRVTRELTLGRSPVDEGRETAAALTSALFLGAACTILVFSTSVFWGDAARIVAVSGPVALVLIVQDALRHIMIVKRRHVRLLVGDSVLLSVALAGSLIVTILSAGSSESLLAVWGVGGVASALVLARRNVTIARPRLALRWLRETVGSSSSFLSDAVIGAVVGYGLVAGLAAVQGTVEVAAYKTVVSVFGLTSVATGFLRSVFLREIRPDMVQRSSSLLLLIGKVSVIVVGVVVPTWLLVVSLPISIGQALFGDIWIPVVGLASAALASRLLAGISVGALVALRVQGVAWRATSMRLLATLAGLPFVVFGVFSAGAEGALLGEAVIYLFTGGAWLVVAFMHVSAQAKAGDDK